MYDDDLKPWDEGYVAKQSALRDPVATGKMGGLKAAERKAAGLLPVPRKPARKDPNFVDDGSLPIEHNIPLKRKVMLDAFVGEYLHDFNARMAWIRVGGNPNSPTDAYNALNTAYVQLQLRNVAEMIDEEKLVTRAEVLMGIKKEANHFGDDGSSSARVRAWGLLAKIKGMEAPIKIEGEVLHKGGVMEVPMVATEVEWQDVAAESQTALKNDVRT